MPINTGKPQQKQHSYHTRLKSILTSICGNDFCPVGCVVIWQFAEWWKKRCIWKNSNEWTVINFKSGREMRLFLLCGMAVCRGLPLQCESPWQLGHFLCWQGRKGKWRGSPLEHKVQYTVRMSLNSLGSRSCLSRNYFRVPLSPPMQPMALGVRRVASREKQPTAIKYQRVWLPFFGLFRGQMEEEYLEIWMGPWLVLARGKDVFLGG